MVLCRLGPLVHGGVNAPHSQDSWLCFPLPGNFCQSIYSVQVPFSKGPYFCFHNFKRRRSCLSDTTLAVLWLIAKTPTQALATSAKPLQKEHQKPSRKPGRWGQRSSFLTRDRSWGIECTQYSNPCPFWGWWPAPPLRSEGSLSLLYFQLWLKTEINPWGCDSLSHSAACPIQTLQHLENHLDAPLPRFWFLRFCFTTINLIIHIISNHLLVFHFSFLGIKRTLLTGKTGDD